MLGKNVGRLDVTFKNEKVIEMGSRSVVLK